MAVKMAVVTNLVAVKGLQVAVNFGECGSEGLPRSGNAAVDGSLWTQLLNRSGNRSIYHAKTGRILTKITSFKSLNKCRY